jgi:hypothetical protein
MRIRICRKEAKETCYWLRLIEIVDNPTLEKYRDELFREATELMNIFGAIFVRANRLLKFKMTTKHKIRRSSHGVPRFGFSSFEIHLIIIYFGFRNSDFDIIL